MRGRDRAIKQDKPVDAVKGGIPGKDQRKSGEKITTWRSRLSKKKKKKQAKR